MGTFGYLIESWEWLDSPRRVMRDPTVPERILDSGDYGRIFRGLGLMAKTRPHVDWRWRGKPRSPVYTIHKDRDSATESAPAAEPFLRDGSHLVSLAIDEGSMNGEVYGLIPNAEVGAERRAHVSLFDGSQLLFSGQCGVRLHGHPERFEKGWASFRLYFREEYGALSIPETVLPGALVQPIKRLIIRGDSVVSSALSFDVARHVGGIAPAMHPTRFLLNGEDQGMYSYTEHLTRSRWEERLGHSDFSFFRSRGTDTRKDNLTNQALIEWAENLAADEHALKLVSQRVDIDNLSRHLFTIIWCGTDDWAQGAMYLDHTESEPRWRWVHWDMDRSFRPTSRVMPGPSWEKAAMDVVLGELPLMAAFGNAQARKHQSACVRGILFKKLIRGDPSYGTYFLDLATGLMNHRLTPDFFAQRLQYYRGFIDGETLGAGGLRRIGEFIANRSEFVRSDLRRVLGVGEPFHCRVDGPEGLRVLIDGYAETLPYAGWYFAGQELSLEAAETGSTPGLSWQVAGGAQYPQSCEVRVRGSIVIEAQLN